MREDGQVFVYSRNSEDMSKKYPDLIEQLPRVSLQLPTYLRDILTTRASASLTRPRVLSLMQRRSPLIVIPTSCCPSRSSVDASARMSRSRTSKSAYTSSRLICSTLMARLVYRPGIQLRNSLTSLTVDVAHEPRRSPPEAA